MKMKQFFLFAGAFSALAALLSGCGHSSQAQPALTKENFGYPGMKMSPGYYAEMKKLHAIQAKQAAGPPAPQAAPAGKP